MWIDFAIENRRRGKRLLLTPKLKLEANPIAKGLGWPFAFATLLICLVPYWWTAGGIIVLVPSLLVSASNTSKIWFVRAYGEGEYLELVRSVARRSKLSHAIMGSIVSSLFIALIGLVLLLLCPDPMRDWGHWFAVGFLAYAFIIGFYGCLYFVRLFRWVRVQGPAADATGDAWKP